MDGLKQRIIGALVLVSLAVIFVPMVFDEPHSERTSTTIQIPEEPPFPEVTAPEADPQAPPAYTQSEAGDGEQEAPSGGDGSPDYRLVEDEAEPEPFTGAPETEAADEAPQTPKASPSPSEVASSGSANDDAPEQEAETRQSESAEYTRSLEGAWVVQLGSFGNADNARRLRDQVRDKGYGSHLQKVERGDNTLTRVFSGPFSSKSDAEAAKRDLDAAFSLNSLVTTGDK